MWPLQDGAKVAVTLTGLNPRTRSMLSTLGLEKIMTCRNSDENSQAADASKAPAADVSEVQPDAGKAETLETMRTAHQDLVRVDQDNAARFCDVLTYLDHEIKMVDE